MWGRSIGVQNEDYTSVMWKLNVYICVFECSDAVFDCFITALVIIFCLVYRFGHSCYSRWPCPHTLLSSYVCFPHWPVVSLLYLSCCKTRVKICFPSICVVRFQFSESLINICALPEDVGCCLAVNKSTGDATFGPVLQCCCSISHFFPHAKTSKLTCGRSRARW